jgi:hypothetical protein
MPCHGPRPVVDRRLRWVIVNHPTHSHGLRRLDARTIGSPARQKATNDILIDDCPPPALDASLDSPDQQSGSSCTAAAALPQATILAAIYPNQCNPRLVIAYKLAEASTNELAIYGLGGRRVRLAGSAHAVVRSP